MDDFDDFEIDDIEDDDELLQCPRCGAVLDFVGDECLCDDSLDNPSINTSDDESEEET